MAAKWPSGYLAIVHGVVRCCCRYMEGWLRLETTTYYSLRRFQKQIFKDSYGANITNPVGGERALSLARRPGNAVAVVAHINLAPVLENRHYFMGSPGNVVISWRYGNSKASSLGKSITLL